MKHERTIRTITKITTGCFVSSNLTYLWHSTMFKLLFIYFRRTTWNFSGQGRYPFQIRHTKERPARKNFDLFSP